MNPIKEALASRKAASSPVEGFGALVRALREMSPDVQNSYFDEAASANI